MKKTMNFIFALIFVVVAVINVQADGSSWETNIKRSTDPVTIDAITDVSSVTEIVNVTSVDTVDAITSVVNVVSVDLVDAVSAVTEIKNDVEIKVSTDFQGLGNITVNNDSAVTVVFTGQTRSIMLTASSGNTDFIYF